MVKVYDQALVFLRTPEQLLSVRQRELPAELTPLLRLAAGESEAVAAAVAQTGATPETMREAAGLFLQQILFVPDGDSYRVLGVAHDASEERIKEHHRWLVRWLHPDRNPDGWEAVYVNRVNAAWQDLRNPARRDAYDRLRSERASGPGGPGSSAHWRPPRAEESPPGAGLLTPRAVRALPVVVLGGLGTIAVLALLLVYARQPVVDEAGSGQESPLEAEARSAWLVEAEGAAAPASAPAEGETGPTIDAPPPREPATALVEPAEATPAASTPPAAITSADHVDRPEPRARVPVPVFMPLPTAVAGSPEAALKSPEPSVRIPVAPVASLAKPSAPSAPEPDQSVRQDAIAHGDTFDPSPEVAPGPTPIAAVETQGDPLRVAKPLPATLAIRAAPATQPPAATPPGLIDARRARTLVEDFSRAYEAGDVSALTGLFASSAGNSRDRILRDYRRLFRDSARRSMQVSNVSWISRGTTATIFGSFDARIAPSSRSRERRIRGDIRFDLREEGGQLRIVDLRHDGTQG